MSAGTIIILLIIGLAAGILSGLIGVGGGIIIVPALVFFLAFNQKQAQGTSLGILLLPVGILGVMQYYKNGYIDLKVVLIVSLGFVIGALFGSKWAVKLPEAMLKKAFAIVMVITALKMFMSASPTKTAAAKQANDTDTVHKLP
jgi:uncharacterized membrane protein YfcA